MVGRHSGQKSILPLRLTVIQPVASITVRISKQISIQPHLLPFDTCIIANDRRCTKQARRDPLGGQMTRDFRVELIFQEASVLRSLSCFSLDLCSLSASVFSSLLPLPFLICPHFSPHTPLPLCCNPLSPQKLPSLTRVSPQTPVTCLRACGTNSISACQAFFLFSSSIFHMCTGYLSPAAYCTCVPDGIACHFWSGCTQ